MPSENCPGSLLRHLAQADEVDQLVDATPRDPVRLRQCEQMVVSRAPSVHRARLQQRTDFVQRRRVVAVVLARSRTSPAVGASSPRISRIVVDFPEPFGPRKPVTMPGWTVNVSPSTARLSP